MKWNKTVYWRISLLFATIAFILTIVAFILPGLLHWYGKVSPKNFGPNFIVVSVATFSWISAFLSVFFHNLFHERDKKQGFLFDKRKRNIPLYLNLPSLVLFIFFMVRLVQVFREH